LYSSRRWICKTTSILLKNIDEKIRIKISSIENELTQIIIKTIISTCRKSRKSKKRGERCSKKCIK